MNLTTAQDLEQTQLKLETARDRQLGSRQYLFSGGLFSRCLGFDPRSRRHMSVECSLLRKVFLRVFRFFPFLKKQQSKFQFDLERTCTFERAREDLGALRVNKLLLRCQFTVVRLVALL